MQHCSNLGYPLKYATFEGEFFTFSWGNFFFINCFYIIAAALKIIRDFLPRL